MDVTAIPIELWQIILNLCGCRTQSRILQVCKHFNVNLFVNSIKICTKISEDQLCQPQYQKACCLQIKSIYISDLSFLRNLTTLYAPKNIGFRTIGQTSIQGLNLTRLDISCNQSITAMRL